MAVAVPAVLAFLAAAGAIGGAVYFFSQDARTRRAIRRVAPVPIAQAPGGQQVRVTGRVLPETSLLEAPLSARPCVYYVATAEERRGTGTSELWRVVAREERFVDFRIEDATGTAHVRMTTPRVAIVHDVNTRSGTFDDASATEEAFLHRHGLKSTNELGLNRMLRYVEGVLQPGEQVTVLGAGRWEVTGSGRRVLVLEAPADAPLMISDDPRAVEA